MVGIISEDQRSKRRPGKSSLVPAMRVVGVFGKNYFSAVAVRSQADMD